MKLSIFSIVSLLVVSSFCFAQEEYTSTQIKKYKQGIFEVITTKLEDKTEYIDEFPHDLIPFHIRNDKYYSVGTAFLVADKTFVSAAHVFGVGLKSLYSGNYALRDSNGKIFTIKKIEKFSDYRDFIQFTVKESTKDYYTFEFAEGSEAGDTVYAAGNALGEGVIFRKGTLTSYTYEPVDGKWKDIRFSAAASPGNSGGPLLNLNGQVVGIVTKKSNNENLNYAYPIDEFVKDTGEKAEFFTKQMGEFESSKRLMHGWEFETSLPKTMAKLREVSEKDFYQNAKDGRKKFVEKFENEIFPKHPNVAKYLKNQGSNSSLSIIDVNGNGEWLLYEGKNSQRIKISGKQSLWFAANDKFLGAYQFFLEKPENQTLKEFVSDPKGILDTFLVSVKWNRNIANTPVYIKSLGEPTETQRHTDVYGRKWQMAFWEDTYSDQGTMIYCLPVPRGVACDLVLESTAFTHLNKVAYKDNLHRIMLSYSADIEEWSEFLDLPKSMLPTFLRKAKVAIKDQRVTLNLGEFSGTFEDMQLTKDSSLYTSVKIEPDDITKLAITYFSLTPNVNEDSFYSVSKFYDLKEDASDSYSDFWKKFTTQTSPYDATVINEGESLTKRVNLNATGKADSAEDVGYLATCKLESKSGSEELVKSCDAFLNGLKDF